jgi:hypothetical protein
VLVLDDETVLLSYNRLVHGCVCGGEGGLGCLGRTTSFSLWGHHRRRSHAGLGLGSRSGGRGLMIRIAHHVCSTHKSAYLWDHKARGKTALHTRVTHTLDFKSLDKTLAKNAA